MGYQAEMLTTHPRSPERDIDQILGALEATTACAEVCRTCADACTAEPMVAELVRCIRLTQDCADICGATASMLARMAEPDGALLRAQLKACIVACGVCAEECERHASMHEHCAICARHCRDCEQACEALLATYN
jgi:hypothetical protein